MNARNFNVAQIFNLLYRRIEFGRTFGLAICSASAGGGGLQIRDTAECNSALHREAE